jgi:hypothetical protein
METHERSQGQLIAAAGGLLLFIFLFLPWFGAGGASQSGWEGQTTTDIYLLITALVAIGTAVTARGQVAPPGATMNGATTLLGGVGAILLFWLAFLDFPGGEDRKIGVYLGLLACLVIAYGGYRAVQEAAGGPARRERRPRPPRESFTYEEEPPD